MDQGDLLRVGRPVLAPSSQKPIISKIKVTVTAALGERYLGKKQPQPWCQIHSLKQENVLGLPLSLLQIGEISKDKTGSGINPMLDSQAEP